MRPAKLLSEDYPRPLGAEPLYRALDEVLAAARRADVVPNRNSRRAEKEEFGLPRYALFDV